MRVVFLAVGMLITGSLNTLTTKIANNTETTDLNGETVAFNHPFVQALGMFLGEMLCLGAFRYSLWRERADGKVVERKAFSPVILLAPACCDLAATSLMYVGLTLTYASVFQMLRGSVVIFTGILSVLFLKRKMQPFHWVGMFLVLIGLGCVGLSSVLDGGSSKNAPDPIRGDVLVIAAQLVVSVQMVLEEKYIGKYDVPALQAVGWEGVFGFCIMSCLLVLFFFIPGSSTNGVFENTPNAFHMLGNSSIIMLATLGNVCSIAFFNFFGISVTKEMSSTTRVVLDSIRTFIIWGFSLIVGWQVFAWLQIVGFALLLTGTCVYQKIIPLRCFKDTTEKGETEQNSDQEKVQRLLDPTSSDSENAINTAPGDA